MSHFSLKSLSFYGVAISSVLILFKVVSTYGENNLAAASQIGGLYQIVESQNLPDCLAQQKLNLTVEQSGRYLFGNLTSLSAAADKKADAFRLSGDFKDPEIILSGKGNLANCNPGLALAIQGRVENGGLTGTIRSPDGLEGSFTAQHQAVEAVPSEAH
jgi:hypothetical protein